MSKKEETLKVVEALDNALKNYGTDVVSVDLNEETGMIDINECHGSWSDCIQKGVADVRKINKKDLIKALDKRHVGHCGI